MSTTKLSLELLPPREVAIETGLSVGTLANMRSAGTGPDFVKLGSAVRYPREALLRWIEESTAAAATASRRQ